MMIVRRSEVVGREVIDRMTGRRVGRAADLSVEATSGRVAGLVYEIGGTRVLMPRAEVSVFGPDAILVDRSEQTRTEPCDEAAKRLEGENEGTVRRLVERMKSRAIESAGELRDVTRALVNKVKADLAGTAEVTREAFNRAVDRARAELAATADYTNEFLDRVVAGAKTEWERARSDLGDFTERLQRAARAAWKELTGAGKDRGRTAGQS